MVDFYFSKLLVTCSVICPLTSHCLPMPASECLRNLSGLSLLPSGADRSELLICFNTVSSWRTGIALSLDKLASQIDAIHSTNNSIRACCVSLSQSLTSFIHWCVLDMFGVIVGDTARAYQLKMIKITGSPTYRSYIVMKKVSARRREEDKDKNGKFTLYPLGLRCN